MPFDLQPSLLEARDKMLLPDEVILWQDTPAKGAADWHTAYCRKVVITSLLVAILAVGFIPVWILVLAPLFNATMLGSATLALIAGGLIGIIVAGLALFAARFAWTQGERARRVHELCLFTVTDRRVIELYRDSRGTIHSQVFDVSKLEGFDRRPLRGGTWYLAVDGVSDVPNTRTDIFYRIGNTAEVSEVLRVLIEANQSRS